MKFQSKEEMLDSAQKITKIKYGFDLDIILKQSKLLKQVKTQKKLVDWF
jgi:hypothetical protein